MKIKYESPEILIELISTEEDVLISSPDPGIVDGIDDGDLP